MGKLYRGRNGLIELNINLGQLLAIIGSTEDVPGD